MTNGATTRTTAPQRAERSLIAYFARHSWSAAAKADLQAQSAIAALKRCATQNQLPAFQILAPAYQNPSLAFQILARAYTVPIFLIVAISLVLSISATGQTQNPSQAQTRQQLLQALDSGRLQDAIRLGEQAVSRWPDDAQVRHHLGLAYFKTGNLKQAQEQLTRARHLDPKDSATHFDLALVFLSEQDYTAAADALEASIKFGRLNANPNASANALAHVLLGRAYLNSNRSLQAIDEFKTALRLDPAIKLGHYHLGFAYYSLGRNDEAIAEYKEELRRSGESPAVVYELGRALLETGKYDAARAYLQRGTELDAQNPDVWYCLGKAQALAGQSTQAESSLRKAAELNPQDPSPHYQLARVLERLGKTEEARSEQHRFAELKKAQPASAGMATGRDQ